MISLTPSRPQLPPFWGGISFREDKLWGEPVFVQPNFRENPFDSPQACPERVEGIGGQGGRAE